MQLVKQSSIRISNMITYLLVQQLMGYLRAQLAFSKSHADTNHPAPELTTARRAKVTGGSELLRCE
jgi:hypothetical protein